MIAEFEIWIVWILGLDEEKLTIRHMVTRSVVVFALALVIVRFGNKRFIGGNTAFDVILGVMLGSVISRAITGQSPFFATLCAAIVLVMLHAVFANFAVRFDRFGTMVKGSTRIIIQDGKVDWDAMSRSNLSHNDLLEALRLRASMPDWEKVKEARLERNGEISFIRKKD